MDIWLIDQTFSSKNYVILILFAKIAIVLPEIGIVFPKIAIVLPKIAIFCVFQALVTFKSRFWINFSIKSENRAEIAVVVVVLGFGFLNL
jgi:hypothetical protein